MPFKMSGGGMKLGLLYGSGSGASPPTPGFTNPALLAALPAKPMVGELGGSRERQNAVGVATGSGEIRQMGGGQLGWAEALNPTLFKTDYHYSAGADANSNHMAGFLFANDGEGFASAWQRVPAALASDVQVVVVALSSNSLQLNNYDIYNNDLGVTATVDGFTAPYKQICAALIAGGKAIMVKGLWERDHTVGGAWYIGVGSPRLLVPGINTDMANWCASHGVPFLDVRPVMSDPANNYDPFHNYCRETTGWTHLSTQGAFAMSAVYAAAFAANFTAGADRDETAAGNLIANYALTGTGGSVDANYVSGSVAPDGWTLTGPNFNGALVTTAKITKNGRTWLEFTVDRSAMTTTRGGGGIALSLTGLTAGQYYEHAVRFEMDADSGWIGNVYTKLAFSSSASYGLAPLDAGGSLVGVTSSTCLPGPTSAVSAVLHGEPVKAVGTTATLNIFTPGFINGGTIKFRISAPEVRQVADPSVLMYNEADTTVATITSASSFTSPENVVWVTTATADKPVRWSLTGTDAAQFRIDKWGRLSWYGGGDGTGPDFEGPTDADANNIYLFNIVATPFNPGTAATTQAVTFTVTDVNDGFSDSFGYNGDPTLVPSPATWTRAANYTVDSTLFTSSGRLNAVTTATGTMMFAPQQGNTINQDLTFTPPSASSGFVVALNLDPDGSMLGAQVLAGKLQLKWRQGTAAYTQIVLLATLPFTLANSRFRMVRIGSTLYLYQNGVLIDTYNVSGICDGTAGSTLAKRSGVITTTSNAPLDNWTSRTSDATPPVSKIVLNTLTLVNGTQTETGITAGIDFGELISGLTGAPSATVTSDISGLFFMDGASLRTISPPSAGSYSVTVTETNANAANNNKTTTFSLTFV